MSYIAIKNWSELTPLEPAYALVGNVDLVIIRWLDQDQASVLYGRCSHRGALLADGHVEGKDLVCGLHGRNYRFKTGISTGNPQEHLHTFSTYIKNNKVWIDEDEVSAWEKQHPQSYQRDNYQGLFEDLTESKEEPHAKIIKIMARQTDPEPYDFGELAAMGVPSRELPRWDDIQILSAQLHRRPLHDNDHVMSKTVIGKQAKKPIELKLPLLVNDMSFGTLSPEATLALATGAALSGTAVCSGRQEIAQTDQHINARRFYEYTPGHDFDIEGIKRCQAFHFKLGRAINTKTDPPSGNRSLNSLNDFRDFADMIRNKTGGIPIGVKLSAGQIEKDLQAAIEIGVDYIILDGRGGGTGASPALFRDNLSVPTIPALARARKYLNQTGNKHISLIISGGLRTPADYFKALALGADAIAVGNAALQAIGCLGMRACQTNKCPVGIATQDKHFRRRLVVENSAEQLSNFFRTANHHMQSLARACGKNDLRLLDIDELTTWNKNMAELSGIRYGGIGF